MTDLVERLLAAIEQRERIAQAAFDVAPGYGDNQGRWYQSSHGDVYHPESNQAVAIGQWGDLDEREGAHIAANDPRAVLLLCQAHREIIELHKPKEFGWNRGEDVRCTECGFVELVAGLGQSGYQRSWPCKTLKIIAGGYGIQAEEGNS